MLNKINGNQSISSSLNTPCSMEYDKHVLKEGDGIIITTKLYKIENCKLQRAYHVCGARLWFVINIVCEAIELKKRENKRYNRFRRFVQQKLLTEACCQSICTINEMTRYCP
jgi:hypothetical protein